jgi:hypothetical protein
MLDRSIATTLLVLAFAGCGTPKGDLCQRTFEPYPDIFSGRVVTAGHSIFLDGMALYNRGAWAEAADSLGKYLRQRDANKAAHLYLANSLLMLGRPFDAELQLDHLENSNLKDFRDQTQWYTVVCWVCSGQLDRALAGARRIAEGPPHTYRSEARRLVKELEAGVR